MTSLTYRVYRLASALRYQVPRHLTPGGLLAISGLVLAGSASFDMDRTVAYQAFAVLACLLGTSLAAKLFFRARFQATRHLPRFASVGHPFRYRVEIRNPGTRAFDALEWFEVLADPRPTRSEFQAWLRPARHARSFRILRSPRLRRHDFRHASIAAVRLPPLPPGATRQCSVEVIPHRRGVLRFRAGSIARPDPLGLVRAFRRLPLPGSVLVLPKRYPVPTINLGGERRYQAGGVALAASLGDAEEFVSLRDYRPGDPLRHIHWRSWARTGRPIVREFQDEYVPRHALILDTFVGPSDDEAFEEAVSVAASFACSIDTQESLLDLLFVGPKAICFTTGRGLGQAEQALEVLAAVQRQPDLPFTSLEQLVLRHARLVCGCVCVFVNWDAPRRALVQRLRGLGLPVLTLVVTAEPRPAPVETSTPHEPKGRASSPQRAGHADNFAIDRADPRKPSARPLWRRATERPPYPKSPEQEPIGTSSELVKAPQDAGVHFLEPGRIAEGLARLGGNA